ncbi:MAG: histidine--tRNA ligase [Pelagibacteraceae bacterium]|nr:histidine--tRNA ligase [Pelagibacteraceae bacterium]|tara:strand:- start:682 stop:1920 length:1239 start_codon:yes stop_codon:yes gene_type:complete
MVKNIKLVRGTHDLVGENIQKFNFILDNFRKLSEKFEFKEIITPIIEQEELFIRSVGEITDIVSKEMYTFIDQGEKKICLRPEATSGIARYCSENYISGAMKLFTHGPMFRRERPQKGRFRQFNQLNIEIIGEESNYFDFEVIYFANLFLKKIGLENKYILKINTIGTKEEQKAYSKSLFDFLNIKKNKLSITSQERLGKNTLRILDSKDPEDLNILEKAPKLKDFLSNESIDFYEGVKKLLISHDVIFEENDYLVRGLDYYCHTAFEFQTLDDKRQNALLAGGRYDGLINMISNRNIPGVGWAAGIERIMDLIPLNNNNNNNKILLAVQNIDYLEDHKLLEIMSKGDISFEIKISKNIKKLFSYADKNKFDYILLIGEEENKKSSCILKNLNSKEQKNIPISRLDLDNEIR